MQGAAIDRLSRAIVVWQLLLLLPMAASAGTIRVPEDYATIKAAISAAVSGDTVLVGPGTYAENQITLKSGVCLLSSDGAGSTAIDGGNSAWIMQASSVNSATVVKGFTIHGGRTSEKAGGIKCTDAVEMVIEENEFRSNHSSNAIGGGAIHCTGTGCTPVIRQNTFAGNSSYGGAGAICFDGTGTNGAQVIGNTIVENSSEYGAGGIAVVNSASPTVGSNIIAVNGDMGFYAAHGYSGVMSCNDSWSNTGGDFVGIPNPVGQNGNMSQDPQFCDLAHDDCHLDSSSPCAPGNHPQGYECGLIGALGIGCGGLGPPAAPSHVTANAPDLSSIIVSWRDNSTNETSFELWRRQRVDGTWACVQIINPDVESWIDSGLSPGITYYYQVRACNGVGCSRFSKCGIMYRQGP